MELENFLLSNKAHLSEYFDNIGVNNKKTQIKWGYIENEQISINFLVNGAINEKITDYNEKVKCLVNTSDNIEELNKLLSDLTPFYTIKTNPFLKLHTSKKENFAFRLTVLINKK